MQIHNSACRSRGRARCLGTQLIESFIMFNNIFVLFTTASLSAMLAQLKMMMALVNLKRCIHPWIAFDTQIKGTEGALHQLRLKVHIEKFMLQANGSLMASKGWDKPLSMFVKRFVKTLSQKCK